MKPPRTGEAQLDDVLIGSRLGEYHVEARIGKGGMGVVYRGEQPLIGKQVAIKVVRDAVIRKDPTLGKRLLAEARAANAIGHRGIIDIFSFGETPGGEPYFVMELLKGKSLDQHLEDQGKFTQVEALQLLIDLMGPLQAAHAAGVIHRDLKPSNVFLVEQPDGSRFVKLLDFGLAKSARNPGVRTAKSSVLGTPGYMAPEQIRGEDPAPSFDLYAAGVMAYQLVVGHRPFRASGVSDVLTAHLERRPPRPSADVEIHPRFEQVILALMEKDPRKRTQTAAEVRDALVEILPLVRAKPEEDPAELTEPLGKPLDEGTGWKTMALRLFKAGKGELSEYPRAAARARDLSQLIALTLETMSRTFSTELAAVFLRDASGLQVPQGTLQSKSAGDIPMSIDAVEAAVAGRDDVTADVAGRSILAVPMRKGTQVGGVLYCQSKSGSAPWGKDDVKRLRSIATHAARALHAMDWPRLV